MAAGWAPCTLPRAATWLLTDSSIDRSSDPAGASSMSACSSWLNSALRCKPRVSRYSLTLDLVAGAPQVHQTGAPGQSAAPACRSTVPSRDCGRFADAMA